MVEVIWTCECVFVCLLVGLLVSCKFLGTTHTHSVAGNTDHVLTTHHHH